MLVITLGDVQGLSLLFEIHGAAIFSNLSTDD